MDKHERIDFAQLPWLISLVFFLLVIWFLLKLSFFFIPALIGALIWLPPFTEWLAEKHAVEIPLWVKIILTVFIIPIIIFGLR